MNLRLTKRDALPCPCGSARSPQPVAERGRRRLPLIRLRCPDCGLTSLSARLPRVWVAWNLAVLREKGGARLHSETER